MHSAVRQLGSLEAKGDYSEGDSETLSPKRIKENSSWSDHPDNNVDLVYLSR